ncbi:MAG TPA: pyrroline-5-carboxylate reductase [Chthoniobacterales bacterium]|jgi:pyrroline-5-carboxylate reductase|nr:pyrroline-5-carboxylate reductase [Chthoniobacterales bacterium]
MSLQTNDLRYRLGFIGGGKLAGSVMRGLMRAKFCLPNEILVSEPNDAARTALGAELGICLTAENAEVAEGAETILIGVKPGVVLAVVEGLGKAIENKLVISLAAGVRVASMEGRGGARFMRAMTNTPAAVCQAATALARGARTSEADLARAREIFSAIGFVAEVEEEQIDAVTALAGSGPAFVYTVIEALAEGGTNCGLPPEISLGLATQTVRGAAQLALESGLSPEELRRMVITPGGTTAAGLAAMEKLGTASGLRAAVEAATARGRELG